MAEKNKSKIGNNDTVDLLSDDEVKVESSTSVHQIKGLSIEKFTKVSRSSTV